MQAFDQVTLQTERLILRPLRAEDAADLFAIFSNPAVMRYWSTPAWTSIETAHKVIAGDLEAMASSEYLRVGAERREDGRLIGTCILYDFNHQCKRAEIGYALAQEAWGRGYMHEALCAVVEYAFSVLDLHRLEADIDPRNEASARALQRLGFQQEGYLRERWIVNGEICDTAFYGLLRREWETFGPTLGK